MAVIAEILVQRDVFDILIAFLKHLTFPFGIGRHAVIGTAADNRLNGWIEALEGLGGFVGQTAISLVDRYPNLLVTQTLSKSRSLAGLRVGLAVGHPDLIEALERIKNSFNSYPLDRMALTGAVAASIVGIEVNALVAVAAALALGAAIGAVTGVIVAKGRVQAFIVSLIIREGSTGQRFYARRLGSSFWSQKRPTGLKADGFTA